MWWYIKKQNETEQEVVYDYGFETKDISGTVVYDKISQEFTLQNLAANDNKKIAERFLFRHLYRLIHDENCPNERQIAIG